MEKMRCKFCDEEHLEIRTEMREVEIKGKTISYRAQYYFCPEMDEEFEEGELININLNRARDAYRKEVGLLTIGDIVEIREKFSLSQKDLAILLGMGEVTITRIESKIIQDKSTDDSIRRIAEDPLFLMQKLELNKEKLGKKYSAVKALLDIDEEVYIYLKKILDIYYMDLSQDSLKTGNRDLSLNKAENMILYFLTHCKNVYKTKLNKLMWFADFLNYKLKGSSISGLAYTHMPFGAVPVGIDEMLRCFKSINIEEKENEEIGYTFYEITALKKFNKKLFSPEELEVLNKVSDKFKSFGNKQISDYMHQEEAYIKTSDKQNIDYTFAGSLREF
ncbi:MAG: type II TA system antitoxin MqsA family protein [Fusobacteriaceae bacterium]